MEVETCIMRMHCLIVCLCEIMLISTSDSLGVADVQFPSKFNNMNHPDFRPERPQPGRSSRSDIPGYHSKLPFSEESIAKSEILNFIETIETNATAKNNSCTKSYRFQIIDIPDFGYEFKPASYRRYKSQIEKVKFISKYLTNLFSHNPDIELRSFSDNHVPAIVSILRVIVEEDSNIAGGGIAFSTKFFPYIYKTDDSTVAPAEDYRQTYKNFTNYGFYLAHKNHKDFSDLNDLLFWEQPYFDCFRLKRWIAGLSLPFYRNVSGAESELK